MDPVKARLRHAVEVADDAATMYLSGSLNAGDAFALNRACSELPGRVRTLRLDLHGVETMNGDAMDAVRAVLRYWRESRGGSFRLSLASEHIVATYAEGSFASTRPNLRTAHAHVAESPAAATAIYL